MGKKLKIGIFTSAWDGIAWDLVKEVCNNAPVKFIFCSREKGETEYGNLMINHVRKLGVYLLSFSSVKFMPKLRKSDTEQWRREHDQNIMKYMPDDLDLIVLIGYMWIASPEMCGKVPMINLHPALPGGPKGTYIEVIWQLIREKADRTGAMMHLVTKDLDMGPPIAFCEFPIQVKGFFPLWVEMEKRLERQPLDEIIKQDGENNPLFVAIREAGVIREPLLLVWTIKCFLEGKFKIVNGKVVDKKGKVLKKGIDLTGMINSDLKKKQL